MVKAKTKPQRRSFRRSGRSRSARYQLPEGTRIEYKNIALLQKFLTERGKIVARRITGVTAKQQREFSQAIKQARYLALISPGPGVYK